MVNLARRSRLTRGVLFALAAATVMLLAPAARSAVVWTFNETSCVAFNGSNCTFQPPNGLVRLTLPDINASGTWLGFYNAATNSFTATGDTDFLFQVTASPLQAPEFRPATGNDLIDDIVFDIAFASSPTALAIATVYVAAHNDLCIQQGSIMVPAGCPASFGQFFVASDFSLLGCNFTQCDITGDWVLALVPEPPSLASLTTALASLLALMLRRASRRRRGSGIGLWTRLAERQARVGRAPAGTGLCL